MCLKYISDISDASNEFLVFSDHEHLLHVIYNVNNKKATLDVKKAVRLKFCLQSVLKIFKNQGSVRKLIA